MLTTTLEIFAQASEQNQIKPPVVKKKSPIKPYVNDFNYFPNFQTKLPAPKSKGITTPTMRSQNDLVMYRFNQTLGQAKPQIKPVQESIFDQQFAKPTARAVVTPKVISKEELMRMEIEKVRLKA